MICWQQHCLFLVLCSCFLLQKPSTGWFFTCINLSLSRLCWPLIFLCVSNSLLWLSNTMPVSPALLFFQLQDLPLIRGTCLVASAFKWRCILVIRQGLSPPSMWDHFFCTRDSYTTKTWDSWSWIFVLICNVCRSLSPEHEMSSLGKFWLMFSAAWNASSNFLDWTLKGPVIWAGDRMNRIINEGIWLLMPFNTALYISPV